MCYICLCHFFVQSLCFPVIILYIPWIQYCSYTAVNLDLVKLQLDCYIET